MFRGRGVCPPLELARRRFPHRLHHEQNPDKEWIADYGEDHDFVRVRVLGKFPRVDAVSFISLEVVREAIAREVPSENSAPVILGVDVARFGNNASVIFPRKGRDARTLQPRVYQGLSTTQLARKVHDAYYELEATTIFVDGGGVGGGVVDQLLSMGLPVIEVQFGGKPDNTDSRDAYTKYTNKRGEIWGAMGEWLKLGSIPDVIPMLDAKLSEELCAPTYTFSREDYIQLETKRDMLRRGVVSPDGADALACTFAYPAYESSSGSSPEFYTDSSPFTKLDLSYA